MANPYFDFNAPFQSGTKVRAEGVNAQFNATESAFDLVHEAVTRQLRIHPEADYGSLEIPNQTLTNGMLFFDENNDVTIFPKDVFDLAVANAASNAGTAANRALDAKTYRDTAKEYRDEAEVFKATSSSKASEAYQYQQLSDSYANENYNVEVTPGKYSAKHYAQVANLAVDSVSDGVAQAAKWAEEDENVEVEPGFYSAKHYSLKAKAISEENLNSVYLGIDDTAKNTEKLGGIPATNHYHTGNKPSKADVGLSNVPNIVPYHSSNKPSKADVGLSNVPNIVPFYTGNLPDWQQVENKPLSYPPSSHSHTKSDAGLANVDNTSDADKPVSTAQLAALNQKVSTATKVNGISLSGNINTLVTYKNRASGSLSREAPLSHFIMYKAVRNYTLLRDTFAAEDQVFFETFTEDCFVDIHTDHGNFFFDGVNIGNHITMNTGDVFTTHLYKFDNVNWVVRFY